MALENKFVAMFPSQQKLLGHEWHSNSGSKTAYLMSNSTLNMKGETPLVTVPSRPSLKKHAFYGIKGGCLRGEDSPSKGERGRMRITLALFS